MVEYKSLFSGESGLLIRTKLNEMLSALITGEEGVNFLWNRYFDMETSVSNIQGNVQTFYRDLKAQILHSYSYTDSKVSDLKTYVNGMSGGVTAFADSTSYDPSGIPVEKSATVLAVLPGQYINFKDEDGASIILTSEDGLTIFYKAAGANYWKHQSILAGIIILESSIDGGGAFNG